MPVEAKTSRITLEFLDSFADAWNRHDVDEIMSAMTEDCVFEASAGVGVRGTVQRLRKLQAKAEANKPKKVTLPKLKFLDEKQRTLLALLGG